MKRRIKLNRQKEWGKAFGTISGWDTKKLRAAKVMVVGAGALGNEVIKNLTLLNLGHLLIVDFDVVEYANLSKSILFRKEDRGSKKAEAVIRNLKQINPEVMTLSIHGDIFCDVGLGVFRRMDVVVGCLDNYLARLYINQHCFKVNKTWVDGALREMSGRYNVYRPGKSCFECSLTETARDIVDFRMSCPDVARRNAMRGTVTTTPISSSIIGAFQVQECLKVIFGNDDQSIAGTEVQYYSENNLFLKFNEAKLSNDCMSHGTYETVIEAQDLSHENTVEEVLNWLSNHFKTKDLRIITPQEIVLRASGSIQNKLLETAVYKTHLFDVEEITKLGLQVEEELYIDHSVSKIDYDFPYPKRSLAQIGIPFLDILTVEAEEEFHFVELTADESKLAFS